MIAAAPTSHGCLFLLAAGISVAVAFVNAGLATALVAAVLCAISAAGFVMAQFSLYRLRVRRGASVDGICGENISLPLKVRNLSFLSRESFVVLENCSFAEKKRTIEVIPPLGPHELYQADRCVKAVRRGVFDLKKIRIAGGDPAGLFRRTRTFNIPVKIVIAPKIVPLDSLALRMNRKVCPGSEDGRPLGIAGQGRDFFGIRPYRPGDEMRIVHWKSTAAKKKLMVREFEASTIEHLVIVLDTFRGEVGLDAWDNNFEMLVSAAASMIHFLSEVYCHVTFITCFDESGPSVIRGDAAGVRNKMMSVLTDLHPSECPLERLLESALETIERGTVFYVLGMTENPEVNNLLSILSGQNVFLHWYHAPKEAFPYVDPESARIFDPSKLPEWNGNAVVSPKILSFNTDLREVLR